MAVQFVTLGHKAVRTIHRLFEPISYVNCVCCFSVLVHGSCTVIVTSNMGFGQPRPRPHYAEGIWKRIFISTIRPTAHTNPLRKRSFSSTVRPFFLTNPSKTLFWLEELNLFLLCGRKMKTQLFENDHLTVIMWFQWIYYMAASCVFSSTTRYM